MCAEVTVAAVVGFVIAIESFWWDSEAVMPVDQSEGRRVRRRGLEDSRQIADFAGPAAALGE